MTDAAALAASAPSLAPAGASSAYLTVPSEQSTPSSPPANALTPAAQQAAANFYWMAKVQYCMYYDSRPKPIRLVRSYLYSVMTFYWIALSMVYGLFCCYFDF